MPHHLAAKYLAMGLVYSNLDYGFDSNRYLANCDSYRFFQQVGGHILTGNTGTNVMDIIVAIVQ